MAALICLCVLGTPMVALGGYSFDVATAKIDADWGSQAGFKRQAWARLWGGAEGKWQVLSASGRASWVCYSAEGDVRTRVDFENGVIDIEAVVLAEQGAEAEEAKQRALRQFEETLESAAGASILTDQLKDENGHRVPSERLGGFLKDQVVRSLVQDDEPYLSPDGRSRRRYSAKIELAPEHLSARARRYLPYVMDSAGRFNLDPDLVMAVIHTESFFNPMAVSGAGAVGLMQIMPNQAGREVFGFLNEQPGRFSIEELFSPRENIQTGAAYLHLLKRVHFADISDYRKNTYLAICAYNWGPTAVRRNILERYDVQRMSADQLYALLLQRTPAETRNYLEKVVARVGIYNASRGS